MGILSRFKKDPEPILEEDFVDDGYDMESISLSQPQGGLQFKERNIVGGDGYTACLTIHDIPSKLNDNWLDPIVNREGVISVVDVGEEDRYRTVKKLQRSMGEQYARVIDPNSQTLSKLEARNSYDTLRTMLEKINLHGETIKRFNVRLYVSKDTEELLEEEVSSIRKDLEAKGFKSQLMQFESKDNYLSMFLSLKQQKESLSNYRRGFPMEAGVLGGSYYFNHEQIIDERGAYYGQTLTQGSVILDFFKHDAIRTYYNTVIFGKMGSGKSTLLKMIEEEQYARGNFVRGFDKAREFGAILERQGGHIIALDGTDGRINFLQVYPTASRKNEKGEHVVSEVGSFKQHISKLKMQFSLMNNELTDTELKEISSAIYDFYIEKGIYDPNKGENQNIVNLKNEDYPVLSELYNYIETYIKNAKKTDITSEKVRSFERILTTVKEMVTEYGEIFDGHTTIKDMENEQVVFFDIEGLTSLSKEVQDTMLFTALQLIWSQALNQGRKYKTMIENGEIKEEDAKRFMFFIDECQNIINANNLQVVEFVVKFQKEMRKFLAGIIFATQSPKEILPESNDQIVVSKLKQIFALTQYKFLFNLDSSEIEQMKRVLGDILTESEYRMIPKFKRGRTLLSIQGLSNTIFNVHPTKQQLDRFKGGL